MHAKRALATLLFLTVLTAARAQDVEVPLTDWRQFTLPGLSETEVEVVRALLATDNFRYFGQVLGSLRRGITSGSVSPQSPEFSAAVEQISLSTRRRVVNSVPGTGFAQPTAVDLARLAELYSWMPADSGTRQFDMLLDVTREPAVLQEMARAYKAWQLPLSAKALSALQQALQRMAAGSQAVDIPLVFQICDTVEALNLAIGARPPGTLTGSLLALMNSNANSRVRTRIQEMFRSIYGF